MILLVLEGLLALLFIALVAMVVVQVRSGLVSRRTCTTHGLAGCTERYTIRGVLHRTDGPAIIRYRADGSVSEEHFYIRGTEHRIGAPAVTHFHEKTKVAIYEAYFIDGRHSRLDGPAEIHRFPDGEVSGVRWGYDGYVFADHSGVIGAFDATLLHDEDDRASFVTNSLRESAYRPLLDEGASPVAVLDALRAGVYSVEGIREVLAGAPAEWVAAFEDGATT